MCEMGAAGAIAHRPHAGGRGPQPVIDLDEAPAVSFDPGGLQADAVGVRGPAGRNQEVRSLDHAVRRMQPYGLAGSPSTRATGVAVSTSIPSSSKSSRSASE